MSKGSSSGGDNIILGADVSFGKSDPRISSTNGHLFLDSTSASTKVIIAYNAARVAAGDRDFEVSNNVVN
jgi:hypothetical protein